MKGFELTTRFLRCDGHLIQSLWFAWCGIFVSLIGDTVNARLRGAATDEEVHRAILRGHGDVGNRQALRAEERLGLGSV